MDIQKLTKSIEQHEGLRLLPYRDTTGNITIGYGTNLNAGISLDEAIYLLGNRVQLAIGAAQAQSWWPNVSDNDARSRAMVELVFNMGPAGVATFKNAIQCLCNNDFNGAADGFLNSLWAKQVGQRAQVLAQMIRTGTDNESTTV